MILIIIKTISEENQKNKKEKNEKKEIFKSTNNKIGNKRKREKQF